MKLGCVVMAAGRSCRFGANKLAQTVGDKTVFLRSLNALPREAFSSVIVVTSNPLFSNVIKDFHFTHLHNDRPQDGISRTIRLGLSALMDCDGVLFCVADQPLLQRSTVSALIDLWQQNPGKIAALAHQGVRGNPCIFPAAFFPELLALDGDRGGSAVICRHEDDLCLLETDPRELLDIDTPEAMQHLLAQSDELL